MLLLYVVLTLVFVFVWLFFSVDCEYEYICGECSATCGEATKECTIRIIQEARYGGKKCPIVGHIHEVVCDDLPDCTPGEQIKFCFVACSNVVFQ